MLLMLSFLRMALVKTSARKNEKVRGKCTALSYPTVWLKETTLPPVDKYAAFNIAKENVHPVN